MPKKFKRRLDSSQKPVTIEGLGQIPRNPDGSVVYGTYTIYYVWNHDGIQVKKPRVLEFLKPDHNIEWRKAGIEFTAGLEAIDMFAVGSESPYHPTKYTNIDLSIGDLQAWFVDRDQNGNIVFEVQVTNSITIDDSDPQASLINDELPERSYVVVYKAEYEYQGVTYNKTITRTVKSVKYTIEQDQDPLYTGRWEPNALQTINLECHRPASGGDPGVVGDNFPTNQEMTDVVPTYILTHRDTGEEIRLTTAMTLPTAPSDIPTVQTTFLVEFEAANTVSGSGTATGLSQAEFDTYVVPYSPLNKTVQYNTSTFIAPPPFTEIEFTISTPQDIIFQDYLSGSNPVPVSFNNSGLFPSEAQLLSDVTATYVDDNGITQNLTVTVTRPTRSTRLGDLAQYFDGQEIIMSIPRTWSFTYSATAPDGTVKTANRKVIIEDTIAPSFNKQFPTTVETGTEYQNWVQQFHPFKFYGIDHPRLSFAYGIARTSVNWSINITGEQFNSLEDGDTFTATATTTDPSGNTVTMTQVIACEDTTSPSISFNKFLKFPLGSNPTEQELINGVITSDLSLPVTTIASDVSVDYSNVGIYSASYIATDAVGNSTTRTRTILVFDPAFVSSPPTAPGASGPVACPTTPGVPNVFINPSTNIGSYTDADWVVGLGAQQGGEDITFSIVVDQATVTAVPKDSDGTIDYDLNLDGDTDMGVTTHFINYELQEPDGTPILCTARYIEIQDSIAPTINDVPNPLVVDIVVGVTNPTDVIAQIKTLIDVVDNVDGTNYTLLFLEGLSQQEIDATNNVTKTLRFIDTAGNESREESVVIQFNISDSDGDGIGDARDQFPNDNAFTTDIDGDGSGDDDAIVIWHHDFEDTLEYLEVREASIDDTPSFNGQASSPFYTTIFSNGVQKRGVQVTNNDFHIQTSKVGTAVGLNNTSLSFAMALETTTPNGGFSLDNADTGRLIYFQGNGNTDSTQGRVDIKIKKLQQISTGDIKYRLSIYHIKENIFKNTPGQSEYNGSRYSNPTDSSATYYNLTDLADYNVLNDVGANELYGANFAGYQTKHYITNFDLPLDSQLHAYTICFQPRTDGQAGSEIAFYVDGDIKQILVKSYNGFGFTTAWMPVTYNLYGFDSMILTDYIWSTLIDPADVIAVQNKMLSASFATPALFGDTDNDGLSDISEDLIGAQFDKTTANTDASLISNHTDALNDYIERYITYHYNAIDNNDAIANYSSGHQGISEDFSQTEFYNYYTAELRPAQRAYSAPMSFAMWFYNDGTLTGTSTIFRDEGSGVIPFGIDGTGLFYINGVSGTQNFVSYVSSNNTDSWNHLAVTIDADNTETKIYLNGSLYETIAAVIGSSQQIDRWFEGYFTKWTHFSIWDSAVLAQKDVTELNNRRRDAEYDLRNKYPIIVNDPTGVTPSFSPDSVEADYTNALLTQGLQFTSSYSAQEPYTTISNLHELDAALNATGTTAGMYEIVAETTTYEGLKTYTKRDVPVYKGFLEEVPFIHPTSGSIHNFTELDSETAMPQKAQSANPHTIKVSSDYLPQATRDYTISMWARFSGTIGETTFFTYAGITLRLGGGGSAKRLVISNIGTAAESYTTNNFFPQPDNWIHLALTIDSSGNLKLYKNGTIVIDQTFAPTQDLSLGGDLQIICPPSGRIDAVDFHNTAVGQDTITNIYNADRNGLFITEAIPYLPVITILGDNPLTIASADLATATDPGATATDPQDGSITPTSDWNTYIGGSTADGTYTITYTATDTDGNAVTATRSVVVTSVVCDDITSLSQYWDGSSTSSTAGSNTLALGGATLSTTDGKYGSDSFNFGASGNKQPMILSSGISLSTGIYTFSLWFKGKRTGSDFGSIIRQGGTGASSANYAMATHQTTNELGLHKGGGSGFHSSGYAMTSFEAGNTDGNSWNHIAVVANGTSSTFYVNGSQVGSVVNQVVTTSAVEIGAYDGNDTQVFAEALDEIAYWDSALEPCQIAAIYNSSVSLFILTCVDISTPNLYFDGSSTAALNSTNNALFAGAASLSTTTGKYGSDSFNFGTSGGNSIVLSSGIDLSTGVYTFSAWFYNLRSTTGTGNFRALVKKNGSGAPNSHYPIIVDPNDELGVYNVSFAGTGYTITSLEGAQQWTHIAVVADSVNSTFYINGEQVGNPVASVTTQTVANIGGYAQGDQTWSEAIDEFAYWDIALSPCEIKKIYELPNKLSEATINNLEESRLATLYGDASINSDGVLTLDGNGDYATYDGEFRWTDKFSISVWFKTQTAPTTGLKVICSSHDAGGVANGNLFALQPNGTLRIKTQDSGTGQSGDAMSIDSNLDDNNWHHLVVTWEASTTNGRSIYLDGQLVQQNNAGVSKAWRTTAQSLLYIGGMWNYQQNAFTSNAWWDGEIDGFRFIRGILSPTEITNIYNNGHD